MDYITKKCRFLSIFPEWEKIIDHFEAEHPIFIKKFLKNMVKYLKMNWIPFNRLADCSLYFCTEQAGCPLHFAIDNADIEFIDIIIPTKLCCIVKEQTLTRMVIQKLNRSLKLILQTFDFSRDKLQRIFLDSCSFANLEMLRYLIYGNWSRGSQSMTTLWDDFYFGQYLVNEGLVCGAKNKHTNVVSFLLHNLSFKFHIYTNSALHIACRNRNFDIVKLLLDHLTENPQLGCINYKNEMGYTALMEACKQKEVEIVKLLLKQDDLQINFQDNEGKTAFYHACQTLSLECVKLLLQHPNIDINAADENGETALGLAIKAQNSEIIQEIFNYSSFPPFPMKWLYNL